MVCYIFYCYCLKKHSAIHVKTIFGILFKNIIGFKLWHSYLLQIAKGWEDCKQILWFLNNGSIRLPRQDFRIMFFLFCVALSIHCRSWSTRFHNFNEGGIINVDNSVNWSFNRSDYIVLNLIVWKSKIKLYEHILRTLFKKIYKSQAHHRKRTTQAWLAHSPQQTMLPRNAVSFP